MRVFSMIIGWLRGIFGHRWTANSGNGARMRDAKGRFVKRER